jgi:pimeloyl-ACP methyl ester carboxylesterase
VVSVTTRWVLLRGLARESAHWGRFARDLSDASGGQVVALDLPGSGRRRDDATPWRVRDLARSCRNALPAHAGPTVLVGMSLGGMVAIEWCRQDPAGIAGCVAVNTSAGGGSPFWQRLRPAHYATLVRMLAGLDVPTRERLVLEMTSAQPDAHAPDLADWIAIANERPMRRSTVLRQLWAAACYRSGPIPPAVPLLVLASAGDRLVAPDCSRRLACRWQVPLLEHAWAGHDLPLDDPSWVIAQVTAWWRVQVCGPLA